MKKGDVTRECGADFRRVELLLRPSTAVCVRPRVEFGLIALNSCLWW